MIGIIYNPVTNSGKSAERMKALLAILDSKGAEYEYVETSAPGDAVGLAKDFSVKCDIVVAAGGDGTVYEVVNGIYGTSASLMILPLGSGNDIARSAGILELDDDGIIDVLMAGKTRPFDAFCVNGERYGLEFVTFNLVVNIIAKFKDPANSAKGYGSVLFGAIHNTRPRGYTIRTENGEKKVKGLFISAQNIQTAGGGLPIYPDAKDDDGKFDMIMIEYTSNLRKYLNLMSLNKGKLCQQPNAKVERVNWVEIIPEEEEQYILDGEFYSTDGVRVEIAPEKISMVVP